MILGTSFIPLVYFRVTNSETHAMILKNVGVEEGTYC